MTRAELEKLTLYAGDGGRIELDDARLSIGDSAALEHDDAIMAAAEGDASGSIGCSVGSSRRVNRRFQLIRALLRHLHRLHVLAARLAAGARSKK